MAEQALPSYMRGPWRRMLLWQRIAELYEAESRCAVAGIPYSDASINERRGCAVECLEDGDFDTSERLCIHTELAIVRHRAREAP
jgi:hypothetical protein